MNLKKLNVYLLLIILSRNSIYNITQIKFRFKNICTLTQFQIIIAGIRQQRNSQTSYIDSSTVYGTSKEILNSLRSTTKKGKSARTIFKRVGYFVNLSWFHNNR